MTSAIADSLDLQLAEYSREVKEFLERLPRRIKRGQVEEARLQCQRIVEGLPPAKAEASWAAAWVRVQATLKELEEALGQALDRKAARAYVLARYDEAAKAYEQWIAARRAAADGKRHATLESLKPLIGPRTTFHMASGVTCAVLYQFFLTRWQAEAVLLAIFFAFGALEVTRRMSGRWNAFLTHTVFKSIARPREYTKLNSSFLYVMALALVTPVFSRPAVLCGALILAFGDPAAAWIGRRYGKVKLYQSKSVVGSLAFVAAGTIVSCAFLFGFYPELPVSQRLLAAFFASAVGAAAEVFSGRLDDNLTIPIASVLVAALFI